MTVLKRSFMILVIFGILLILFGTVFALQGDNILPGSSMSGVAFWLYAGSVTAVIGLILAVLGFVMGSRSGKPKAIKEDKKDVSMTPGSTKP